MKNFLPCKRRKAPSGYRYDSKNNKGMDIEASAVHSISCSYSFSLSLSLFYTKKSYQTVVGLIWQPAVIDHVDHIGNLGRCEGSKPTLSLSDALRIGRAKIGREEGMSRG